MVNGNGILCLSNALLFREHLHLYYGFPNSMLRLGFSPLSQMGKMRPQAGSMPLNGRSLFHS